MRFVHLFFSCLVFYSSINFGAIEGLLDYEQNTINVYKKTKPYVVNINRLQKVISPVFDTYEVPAGMGSGFIWDMDGHVVTNFHVIAGQGPASSIVISFDHDTTIRASVVGVEPRKDIAVLKILDASILKKLNIQGPLEIADSTKIEVGEKAIAIGNPFGLSRTLTTGVISALGREVPGIGGVKIRDMIQTDASINRGNSGGVLLNSRGQLIGMNTVIFSQSGGSIGIGFAVPSNDIKRVVTQIIKHGRVIMPGIGFLRLDDTITRQLGIEGVIVGKVTKGTPAEKAGLRGTHRDNTGRIHLGDIITAINNKPIKNYDALYQILESMKVGEEIILTYQRGQQEHTVKIKTVDLSELE